MWARLVVVMAAAGMAEAGPCEPGAEVDYPLAWVLDMEAREYASSAILNSDLEMSDLADPAHHWPAYLAALEKRSAELPAALADLPYLIVLSDVLDHLAPLSTLTFSQESAAMLRMAEALERQGLKAEAALLRTPMAVFPDWDAGPVARSRGLGSAGWPPPGEIGEAINRAQESLKLAAPQIRAKTEALIANDVAVVAAYEAQRMKTDPETRLIYLSHLLRIECLPASWRTPEELDRAFAAMPRPQADILLLDFFLTDSDNSSMYDYFFNSTGGMAPQIAEVLDRIGLPDHAAGIRQGIAIFPEPYPRDIEARRDIMLSFTQAETGALRALNVWAYDGHVYAALLRLVEEAGLMPR
ncbi:DMP19 family protein [Tabrizicola sp.]|uniref:DMP19 family protein n=1 Tax=Tabrizicola sp. TaxID=2005166 RepID=UPI003F407A12